MRITIIPACALALLTSSHVPQAAPAEVILRAADATVRIGSWSVTPDTTAAGGSRLANADAGAPKVTSAAAAPAHYAELTFDAQAGTPYRLWIRGKAHNNSYANDSVYFQFSGSVTAAGDATWRIGTASATSVILENCYGCGLSNWGWTDNGYGGDGPLVYFATSGTQAMRIQPREDGLSIDQIVLSPVKYLDTAPGLPKNDNTIIWDDGSEPPAPEPEPSPADTVTFVRQPYLQQVSSTSATIVWATLEPGPAHVIAGTRRYAAASEYFPASATGMAASYHQHVARITELAPATTYAYDLYVGDIRATSGSDRLTTAAAGGASTTTFIAFGDSGTGSSAQRALATVMNGDTFDFAVHTGDLAYGTSSGVGDATYKTYQSWFFDVYRDLLRRRAFFPAMGNHDSRAGTSHGKAYKDVFVLDEEGGAGAYPDHAERYYSFDYGPVHVVVLDSELALLDAARRSAQLAWLEQDLSATAQAWKVAVFHRSPYSSGGEHGSDLLVRDTFAPVFERHNVQMVFSAHDHNYERSAPWRRDASSTAGQAVTYIVTGGGGGPLYPVGKNEWTAYTRYAHHYAKVSIGGCTATVRAVDRNNATFDSWTLDRCRQATDASPPSVSISAPAQGATVSGVVQVKVTATDDVKVEKVDLWVDGALKRIDRTAPYTFSWDTASVAAGSHTLEARAYDIDGKRVRSVAVRVTR